MGLLRCTPDEDFILEPVNSPYIEHLGNEEILTSDRKKAEQLLEQSKAEINNQLIRNQLILDSTLDGYVLTDTNANIIDVNAAYCNMTGYSKGELLKMNMSQLSKLLSKTEIDQKSSEVINSSEGHFEDIQIKKDGTPIVVDVKTSFMRVNGVQRFATFIQDITIRKKAQKELEYRLDLENLLTKLSTQFINLSLEDIDTGIRNALQQISEFTNFDRSFVVLFSKEETFSVRYEWYKSTLDPLIEKFQNVPFDIFSWLIKKIKSKEYVLVNDRAELSKETGAMKPSMEMVKLQSLIFTPMIRQGKAIGFIGFGSEIKIDYQPIKLGTLLRFAGEMISNILQRKEGEEALITSEKHLKSIFNGSTDQMAILMIKPKGKLILEETNQSFKTAWIKAKYKVNLESIYGITLDTYLEEILGFSKQKTKEYLDLCHKVIAENKPSNFEGNYLLMNNKKYLFDITISPILNEDNVCTKLLVVIRDITLKHRVKEKMISKILEAEDRERSHFAKELHDSLGQNLTAALLTFNQVKKAEEAFSSDSQKRIELGIKFLKEAIEESRNIAHNLMPQSVSDFGYILAVESLLENLSQSAEIEFTFYNNLNYKRLPLDLEFSLYRITQEAINNILKHAEATKVTIQLIKHIDSVILTIEDNGKGFDISTQNRNSFGFNSMRTRASALSGFLAIDGILGSGTSITLELPVLSNEK